MEYENIDWKAIWEEYGEKAIEEIREKFTKHLKDNNSKYGSSGEIIKYYLDTEGDLVEVLKAKKVYFDVQQLFAKVDYDLQWFDTGHEDEDRQLAEDYYEQVKKELTKDDVQNLLSFYLKEANYFYETLEEIEDNDSEKFILGLLDRFVSNGIASQHFTVFFDKFKNHWINYIVHETSAFLTTYEYDGEPIVIQP